MFSGAFGGEDWVHRDLFHSLMRRSTSDLSTSTRLRQYVRNSRRLHAGVVWFQSGGYYPPDWNHTSRPAGAVGGALMNQEYDEVIFDKARIEEACLDAGPMISFPVHGMHDRLNFFSRLLDAIMSNPSSLHFLGWFIKSTRRTTSDVNFAFVHPLASRFVPFSLSSHKYFHES